MEFACLLTIFMWNIERGKFFFLISFGKLLQFEKHLLQMRKKGRRNFSASHQKLIKIQSINFHLNANFQLVLLCGISILNSLHFVSGWWEINIQNEREIMKFSSNIKN